MVVADSADPAGQPSSDGRNPGYVARMVTLARHSFLQGLKDVRRRQGDRREFLSETTADQDVNHIAVIEDDGSIVGDPNPLDLKDRTIRFEPATSTTYKVSVVTAALETDLGTVVSEGIDSKTMLFPGSFRFPFYGTVYDRVYVNANGNLTFSREDITGGNNLGIKGWNLYDFLNGPPRIAPLLCNLYPAASSGIYMNSKSADRIVFTWNGVAQYDLGGKNYFQIVLFADGKLDCRYGSMVDAEEAIAGISPGDGAVLSVADLSRGTSTPLSGAIGEWYHPDTEVDVLAAGKKFYRSHPDRFFYLTLFSNFPHAMNGVFSYSLNIKNVVSGLGDILENGPGLDLFDDSSLFGSYGVLEHFIHMGELGKYPDDPTQTATGTYSTLDLLTRHSGHRWMAYAGATLDGVPSGRLVGNRNFRWSFFLHSEGSVMGGNNITDQGNGSFLTGEVLKRFSGLDQYLMGLRWSDEVSPFFLVNNPTGLTQDANSAAVKGISFQGTRVNVGIQNVIQAEGLRQPTPASAIKIFPNAFLLLTRKGTAPTPAELNKIQDIRRGLEARFAQSTEQRGFQDTRLSVSDTSYVAYVPILEGDGSNYTALAVANRADYPARIRVTAYGNDGKLLSLTGMANPSELAVGPGGQRALIDFQWFHFGSAENRQGWILLESSSDQVGAFFLTGDSSQTRLDGGLAQLQTADRLIFTRVFEGLGAFSGQTAATTFSVINPGPDAAALQFVFWSYDGREIARSQVSVPAKGRMRQSVAQLFPTVTLPVNSGWVELQSDKPVAGFELIRAGASLFGLPGQSAPTASKLYSAQFASGGAAVYTSPYFTDLCLVNTGIAAAGITARVVAENGSILQVLGASNPLQRTIPAKGTLCGRAAVMFGFPNDITDSQARVGSVIVEADSSTIAGDVVFGDAPKGSTVAGLPLQAHLVSDLLFSQVAEGQSGNPPVGYFTGIAALNPNPQEVQLNIEVFSEEGKATGTKTMTMPAGSRFSQTLGQLVPAATGQMRGFIRIRSTGGGIAVFELFGDTNLSSFLSAVPPQPLALVP